MILEIQRTSDGVLTLTMAHPPVNAVDTQLRAALLQALQQAERDDDVQAVVLASSEALFSAGADLLEFSRGRAFDHPSLHAVVLPFIYNMRKPVVAALTGRAIGGGLELALWCHARVAAPDAPLGLPETTLGLMPGAGGTQLLPRAIGLERATSLIISGGIQAASNFEGTALIDEFAPVDAVLATAQRLALKMASEGAPFPHLARRRVEHPQPQGFLAFARAQARARRDFVPGMLMAIDAIAMSLKVPALQGLSNEFEMFRPLVASPPARAIRHAFFAERQSAKVFDLPVTVAPRSISTVAVIGSGFMGSGIAHCFARAGIAVRLFDVQPGAADKAAAQLQSSPELDAQLVSVAHSLDDVRDVDLVIEAIVENLAVKQALFRQLDAVMRPGAILATNTSTLDVDALAAVTARAVDVVGMHFFGPAPVMRLLEVVRTADTAPEVLATALALAKRLRKIPVVSRVAPGFIGNRIFDSFLAQALDLAAQGLRPAQIDIALERWGWRMGPFKTMDLIGNDVLLKARRADQPMGAGEALLDCLVAAGRLGQKAGKGWYLYSAGSRQALPDAAVESMLPPNPTASLDAEAIVDRCMLAMINESVKVLDEGVAQRASDIDVTFLLGYGFPRLRGGPMFYAEESGLAVVGQKLLNLQRQTGQAAWAPASLLTRLAQTNGRF